MPFRPRCIELTALSDLQAYLYFEFAIIIALTSIHFIFSIVMHLIVINFSSVIINN